MESEKLHTGLERMMKLLNRVILMGRITQDLELKQTQSGNAVLSFTVAVERNYAPQGQERQTDFISCVAWRQKAEFINNYFAKGRMIAIEGNLQTRTYDDKNGTKHYVTEVVVDNDSFSGEPKQQSGQAQETAEPIGNLDDFEVVISDDNPPF